MTLKVNGLSSCTLCASSATTAFEASASFGATGDATTSNRKGNHPLALEDWKNKDKRISALLNTNMHLTEKVIILHQRVPNHFQRCKGRRPRHEAFCGAICRLRVQAGNKTNEKTFESANLGQKRTFKTPS